MDSKVDDVPDRVVVCKSQEPTDSQWCGAAEALMKCTQHVLHDKVKGRVGCADLKLEGVPACTVVCA